jgi:hypothetical protein
MEKPYALINCPHCDGINAFYELPECVLNVLLVCDSCEMEFKLEDDQ